MSHTHKDDDVDFFDGYKNRHDNRFRKNQKSIDPVHTL